jgi:hypothetical protein
MRRGLFLQSLRRVTVGQIIIEDGIERELIKVSCEVTEDNPNGYIAKYRDQMLDGEIEHSDEMAAIDYSTYTKSQLQGVLNELNYSYSANASKADLLTLIQGA